MMNRVLIKLLVVMYMIILIGCGSMRFNQTADKRDLLTEKYSIEQIEEVENSAQTGNITFSDFKRDFNVQCIRKTHQGYYVVLLVEEGGNAFVFFNKEDVLRHVLISEAKKNFKVK